MRAQARPRALRVRETIGHVVIAAVVIGLIALVYWIVTEKPCSRYPGIEKLRGGTGSLRPGPIAACETAICGPIPVTDGLAATGRITMQVKG